MAAHPIIDVEPVAQARDSANRASAAAPNTASRTASGFRAPSYGRPRTASAHEHVDRTTFADAAGRPASRLTGAAQAVGGVALAAIGIPMLILPGPGLLAIGGGAALAARGIRNLKQAR